MLLKRGVSIIICTFNGKSRLTATLEHLVAQTVDAPFEIILIDNASTDGTKEFADSWWETHGSDSTVDYSSYMEPTPGKSYAQALGYSKAKYAYLLICDDDNWLCNTYVQRAFEIMERHIDIGALGGRCDAVFDTEKPDWFDHYSRFYAVGSQSVFSGDVTDNIGYLYGAGMVIRAAHWQKLQALGFEHLLSCRKGDTLSSGGDTEFCFALRLLGYKIWYDEALHFKHYMTEGRLNLTYLSRLRKATAYSNFVISSYNDVLLGVTITKRFIFKRIFNLLQKGLVNNIYRYFFGTFEQKEVSKNYFRKLYYMCFRYKTYSKHVTTIKFWLPKRSFN